MFGLPHELLRVQVFMESIKDRKQHRTHQLRLIPYIIMPELPQLESQKQDNPSTWYSLLSLLQITEHVYHFSDISLLASPKGGLDLLQTAAPWETEGLENAGSGLYKTLMSELCLISAYLFGITGAVWLLGCIPYAQAWIHFCPL